MITSKDSALDYLYAYQEGKIKKGLGIGCLLDSYLLHKRGSFNIIVGMDNVGKTNFMMWYFLCLSKHHNLKWCIWSGENSEGQLKRDLIQMYTGEKVTNLTKKEIIKYNDIISKWFLFIDNSKTYNHKDLLKIFKENKVKGCFIDPFTGLAHDRKVNQWERNYLICNDIREFCNTTGIAVYINTHPQTEAARRVYPDGHKLKGYIQPCKKSDVEGGQVFANRCDQFISIHRMLNHPTLWMMSEIRIEKVKDKETGGKPTDLDSPMRFDWNEGMGFTIGGINPLKIKTTKN